MKLLENLRTGSSSADEMPFLDHMEELRWRILWSLLALLIGAIIGFVLVTRFNALGLLIDPIQPYIEGAELVYLNPTDPFFITLKLALLVGILLVFPILVYQVWAFLSPALREAEKRAIVPALYLGLVLFTAGVALAYFYALPVTFDFLLGFQTESLEQNITINNYIGFVLRLLLAFGFLFELPVVILVLSALGVVNSEMLSSKRRYAYAGIVVVAAVITPGDVVVVTVLLMVPLALLYELGIVLARVVEKRRAPAASDEGVSSGSSGPPSRPAVEQSVEAS